MLFYTFISIIGIVIISFLSSNLKLIEMPIFKFLFFYCEATTL